MKYKTKSIMITEEQINRILYILNDYQNLDLNLSFSNIIRQSIDEGLDNVEERLRNFRGDIKWDVE